MFVVETWRQDIPRIENYIYLVTKRSIMVANFSCSDMYSLKVELAQIVV